jgi:hypothetical protein
MADVFQATDEELGVDVAIKLLKPRMASDELRARMVQEAQAAAQVRHDNLVRVFGTGKLDAPRTSSWSCSTVRTSSSTSANTGTSASPGGRRSRCCCPRSRPCTPSTSGATSTATSRPATSSSPASPGTRRRPS